MPLIMDLAMMMIEAAADTPTVRVFSSAGRYVQGPGALAYIGEHVAGIGTNGLILIDGFMFAALEPKISASLRSAQIEASSRAVASEVTESAITQLAERAPKGVDFVIGVGGGKTIDIAKGISLHLGVPVVTVPTIASNDSPASRAIAIYDDEHQLSSVPLMMRNPALVLVDTTVVFGAPARFLSAGIGDAISKHFEVEACRAAGGLTPQGTRGLRVASILAAGCYDVLRKEAAAALAAMADGTITQAFEDTIEAVVLLSGLSFENGGLSVAHALTRGLMATPGASARLHGEQVAYGLLVQLALQNESDEVIRELGSFLHDVGLSSSLEELGSHPSDEVREQIVRRSLTAPHIANFPEPVETKSLLAALRRVEALAAASN